MKHSYHPTREYAPMRFDYAQHRVGLGLGKYVAYGEAPDYFGAFIRAVYNLHVLIVCSRFRLPYYRFWWR